MYLVEWADRFAHLHLALFKEAAREEGRRHRGWSPVTRQIARSVESDYVIRRTTPAPVLSDARCSVVQFHGFLFLLIGQ